MGWHRIQHAQMLLIFGFGLVSLLSKHLASISTSMGACGASSSSYSIWFSVGFCGLLRQALKLRLQQAWWERHNPSVTESFHIYVGFCFQISFSRQRLNFGASTSIGPAQHLT